MSIQDTARYTILLLKVNLENIIQDKAKYAILSLRGNLKRIQDTARYVIHPLRASLSLQDTAGFTVLLLKVNLEYIHI